MKKQVLHIILLCSLLLVAPLAHAQYKSIGLGGRGSNFSDRKKDSNGLLTGIYSGEHYLFGGWMDGAYSTMPNNIGIASIRPGGQSYGAGACFEYQHYWFKLQLGLSLKYQNVWDSVANMHLQDDHVRDQWNYDYTLLYDFDHRIDQSVNWHFQMPILIGAGISHMYFLTGVKLNYTYAGRTSMHAIGSTSGVYEQYLGHYVEMDNHGFRKNVPMDRIGEGLRLKPDILYSIEIGSEWSNEDRPIGSRYRSFAARPHVEYRFRVAGFVDFGLRNINPNSGKAVLQIPEDHKYDFGRFEMNHVFSSKDASGMMIHNLYAGVKFTVLVGWYVDKTCVLCQNRAKTEVDWANPYSKVKW